MFAMLDHCMITCALIILYRQVSAGYDIDCSQGDIWINTDAQVWSQENLFAFIFKSSHHI